MSDEIIRRLEREALSDPAAAAALARARCRAEGHTIQDGALYMQYDADAFVWHGDLSSARTFQRCTRCRADVPYEGTLSGTIDNGWAKAAQAHFDAMYPKPEPPPRVSPRLASMGKPTPFRR